MSSSDDPDEPRTSGLAPRARPPTSGARVGVRLVNDPAADPLGATVAALPVIAAPRVARKASAGPVIVVVAIFLAVIAAAVAYALS